MIKIEQIVEFKTDRPCVDIEDGGRAMIGNPEVLEGEDPHFFLRFQSWDDDAHGPSKIEAASKGHPLLNSMLGKKFRVVIEEIPEETVLDRVAKVAREQIEAEHKEAHRKWVMGEE